MSALLTIYVGVAVGMAALWARQLRTQNATSVDVAWSGAFAFYALGQIIFLNYEQGWAWRPVLVAFGISVWSLRLAFHLYLDRCHGAQLEDRRYAQLRATWSSRKFFFFYQMQALSTLLLAGGMAVAIRASRDFRGWDLLGFFIFIVAIGGESLADHQLRQHRHDSAQKGRTCQRGLWRYSRHPNYFFEWLGWWAYVAFGWGHPLGYLTFLGPLVIFYLLFNVTGIPPTEMQARKSRVDYADYQKRTSVFFPWFPKG